MIKHIGITGTRQGCTTKQFAFLERLLKHYFHMGATTFHHGDCIGVDAEAHHLATKIGYAVEIHPPLINKYRAFCEAPVIHIPKGYKVRDTDIVVSSDRLLVVPAGPEESFPRSGTWMTCRIARRTKTPYKVIER